MRLSVSIITVLCTASFAFGACGDHDADDEAYPTYRECWDDHHNVESLTVEQAIVVCCLAHPIGDQAEDVVCGETAAACETYLGAELETDDATATEITDACADFIVQREA